MKNQKSNIVAIDINAVKSRILEVRNQQVLLDRAVAALYGVETRVINQAVKNNPEKFPAGYVVELSSDEFATLRSKFLTANVSSKSRALPKVFTERGLYMLATILKGEEEVSRVRNLPRAGRSDVHRRVCPCQGRHGKIGQCNSRKDAKSQKRTKQHKRRHRPEGTMIQDGDGAGDK